MENLIRESRFSAFRDTLSQAKGKITGAWEDFSLAAPESIARFCNFARVIIGYLGIYVGMTAAGLLFGSLMIAAANADMAKSGSSLIRGLGFAMICFSLVPFILMLFIPRYQREAIGDIADYYLNYWVSHRTIPLVVGLISAAVLIWSVAEVLKYLHYFWYTMSLFSLSLITLFVSALCFQIVQFGLEQAQQKTPE